MRESYPGFANLGKPRYKNSVLYQVGLLGADMHLLLEKVARDASDQNLRPAWAKFMSAHDHAEKLVDAANLLFEAHGLARFNHHLYRARGILVHAEEIAQTISASGGDPSVVQPAGAVRGAASIPLKKRERKRPKK